VLNILLIGGVPKEHMTFIADLYTFGTHQSRLAHSHNSLSDAISTLKPTLTNAKRLCKP